MSDKIEFRGRMVNSDWPQQLAEAQKETFYIMSGKKWPRIPYGEEKSWLKYNPDFADNPCHDCIAVKGEYHAPGCDVEACPKCGGQAIGCDCSKSAMELSGDVEVFIENDILIMQYVDDEMTEHTIPLEKETFLDLLKYADDNLPEWRK